MLFFMGGMIHELRVGVKKTAVFIRDGCTGSGLDKV